MSLTDTPADVIEETAADKAMYEELGDKIWDEVPYDYQGNFDNIQIQIVEGPAKDFSKRDKRPLPRFKKDAIAAAAAAGTPVDEMLSEEEIAENPQKSVWWYCDG